MTKAKGKASRRNSNKTLAGGRGARKPADLEAIRQQICDLVGSQAVDLVETTIGEVDKGHYGAMKYLFEIIGLYPATLQEIPLGEDSLAKTLLRRLGLPEEALAAPRVTKDPSEAMAAEDAVE